MSLSGQKAFGPPPANVLHSPQPSRTTTGIIPDLAPGRTVLVVRNLAAFVSRYGGGRDIAGQYAGQLDNRGENLRLVDANGEVILDFNYDPEWYPITEGIGFSLEIADENAPWDSWNLASSWRPSRNTGGSPARSDAPSARQRQGRPSVSKWEE